MKNPLFTLIACFGIATAPNHLSAQEFRHRIALQTGLFHYFFDKSPVLNVNHPTHYQGQIFNGLFIDSYGINYTFCINEKSNISIEWSSFNAGYIKQYKPFQGPVMGARHYKTAGLAYARETALSNHFVFTYGAGLNYRYGHEEIILSIFAGEGTMDVIQRRDFGLNTFAGISYNFCKRFFCYSKVDFLSTLYFKDQEKKAEFAEIHKAPQFPTRFDLSFKLGIGIKFSLHKKAAPNETAF